MTNKASTSSSKNPLPQLVHEVGDRIGLNYNIERKTATRKYIESYQTSHRLDFEQLKNSVYNLNETRTKKAKNKDVSKSTSRVKNPLKLNSKTRKSFYKLTPEEKSKLQFHTFERVNQLWQQYCDQIIGDRARVEPIALFRLDLHGAYLKVNASRNPTLIGTEGIVVQETKNTFILITKTSKIKTISKQDCLFEMKIREKRFIIHGCNLLSTVQGRSKLKCKQKKLLSSI